MTGSFTPQGKTSPSAKPRRCEVGAWQTEAVREEPPCRSVFPLRLCGKAGQPWACSSPPFLCGASGRASGEQCRDGKHLEEQEASRTLQLRGLADGEHCVGSQETPVAHVPLASEHPGAVMRSSLQASVSLAIQPRVSVAWDALSGGGERLGPPNRGGRVRA